MQDLVIRGRLLDSPRVVDVAVRQGRIHRVSKAGSAPADFGSPNTIIGPTLFDIQVNGAGGVNLQGEQLRPEDVHAITAYLRERGVSAWIPTLVTASLEAMEHGCMILAEVLKDRAYARICPGIHLEGPFISPADGPRGAHPLEQVRKPAIKDFMRLYKAANGRVTYTTVAPDQPGALPFIARIVSTGVAVSIGHHGASPAQVHAAADAGVSLSTHLGNGLFSTIHRHHNPLWPQLAEDRLHASLIADLHHLPEEVLKVFVRAKDPARIVLTSDAVDLAGLAPGKYAFGGAEVELRQDGKICLVGTDLLAGSSLMLLRGVVNAWQTGAMTLEQAFASASTIPARLFGFKRRFRLPKVGDKADFLAFDLIPEKKGLPRLRVRAVFVEGQHVEGEATTL